MFTVKGQGFGSKLDEQCSRAQQDGRLCTDLLQVPITFEVQDTVRMGEQKDHKLCSKVNTLTIGTGNGWQRVLLYQLENGLKTLL